MPEVDEASFEAWYTETYPSVLAVLTVVLGDPGRACEGADEAFTRAYERWNRVRQMGSPAGWTYRVALNAARRDVRREALERSLLPRLFARHETTELNAPSAELWDAVQSLTTRQRTVLAMRVVLGLPQEEVAGLLGIRPGTVAATLAKARDRLRQRLILDDADRTTGVLP